MKKNSKRRNKSCDQTRADPTIRCWSDIPVDLLSSVAERLIYPDFIRLRAVCKNWQQAFSYDDDLRRRAVLPLLRVDSFHHYDDTKTLTVCTSRFFDMLPRLKVFPIRNVVQEQASRENLLYPSFCCSYSGWLLLLKSDCSACPFGKPKNSIFFVHSPFRDETLKLDLPSLDLDLEWPYRYRVVEAAGFSTTASSRDCIIFVLWKYRNVFGYDSDPEYNEWDVFFITTYNRKHRKKHRSWRTGFELPRRNPEKEWKFIKYVAYLDGSFYCAVDMDSKVVLGTFNVAHQKWDMMVKRSLKLPSRPEQMNFVKSDEGLLLAICYQEQFGDEYFYHIYQFDLPRKEWTRVNTLGNRVLMLRSCSSVATPAVGVISKLANMIFVCGSDSESYLAFTWESEGEWRWRGSCISSDHLVQL